MYYVPKASILRCGCTCYVLQYIMCNSRECSIHCIQCIGMVCEHVWLQVCSNMLEAVLLSSCGKINNEIQVHVNTCVCRHA